MRSLVVIVIHGLLELLADASPTAYPRIVEAVDLHFEDVKPFFDRNTFDSIYLAAQIHRTSEVQYTGYATDDVTLATNNIQRTPIQKR